LNAEPPLVSAYMRSATPSANPHFPIVSGPAPS
jgi:hypothetical protein